MKRRRKSNRSGRAMLIILVLLIIIGVQSTVNIRLNRQLKSITLFDIREDTIAVYSGKEVDAPLITITPDFLKHTFVPRSPFKDGKSFAQLIDEYLRYGHNDMYGSARITGDIRRIHEGIDFFVPEDTPLYPVFPVGIVTEVQHDPNHILRATGARHGVYVDSVGVEYGKIVRILYPEGIESLYAHLNEIHVQEGQIVGPDTIVGTTGFTGNILSSGKPSHLHIELRDINNESFDPQHRMHYDKMSIEWFIKEYLSKL